MAAFEEHIRQAKSNLLFLLSVNNSTPQFWDWQVTICFYAGVHIINAHTARKADMHFKTHDAVKSAINPEGAFTQTKVPENIYTAYVMLQGLSRLARYLCNEGGDHNGPAFFAKEKHFKRALHCLDQLIKFVCSEHRIDFENTIIRCSTVSFQPRYFTVEPPTSQ